MSVPTPDEPGPPGRPGTEQATFAATLVDEWGRAGVTDAVVCPGSRSTPLAVALDAAAAMACHVRLDERSAGFYALGLALATDRPTVVCTTSGTAAAELHPAVIEAHLSRVPLIVCTADRPPELHHVGAPQTIEQTHLFGSAVRWFVQPGLPGAPTRHTWRPLAARAFAEATGGPAGPGPVHLNLAFGDPLSAAPGPLPAGRAGRRVAVEVHGRPAISSATGARVAARLVGRRGLVVAGQGGGPGADLLALAHRLGWPVLADPRSGARRRDRAVVAAADALVRSDIVSESVVPEVVVTLGAPWVSKALNRFLDRAVDRGAEVVAVDPWWRWRDPDGIVGEIHRADPGEWVRAVLAELPEASAPAGWSERWAALEAAAQGAIERVLDEEAAHHADALSEPALARRILGGVPEGTAVLVSSSMPVRDLEWFAPALDRPPVVRANRGANGIDGVCATALGMAGAGLGPVVAIVGDLAFLHDASALVRTTQAPGPTSSCTLIVVDNGGGGIFSFLPQAAAVPRARFERLFATPPEVDVAAVARGFSVPTIEVSTGGQFDRALDEVGGGSDLAVIVARLPARSTNVELHERLDAAVSEAAQAELAAAPR